MKRKQQATKLRGIFEKPTGSGLWWIRYVDASGRYRREQAGTLKMATVLLAKRKTETLQGKKLPENLRRQVPFSEIALDALAYSQARKRSHRSDGVIKNRLVEWFGVRTADSLSGTELEQRLEAESKAREWAASTFNHYRSFLMLAYREARRSGKVQSNPARDIRHRKENNSRVRFLSRGDNGEFARLAGTIRQDYPEHWPELVFALNTGLRLGSQYSATYEMIDWTRNTLDLPTSKTSVPLHIPLNVSATAALRLLPSWKERRGPIFRNLRHPARRC